MGVKYLEHFLILTDDIDATRDWWCAALGLTPGWHPEFGFPVHWLYIGDQDVIHIGKRRYSEHQDAYMAAPGDEARGEGAAAGDTGALDHVCFACEGLEETFERLREAAIEFNERQVNGQALYQIFFREPINGIKVELNFPAEEARAAGRMPGMTAADAG